jgi:hypothetical protein
MEWDEIGNHIKNDKILAIEEEIRFCKEVMENGYDENKYGKTRIINWEKKLFYLEQKLKKLKDGNNG